MTVGESQSNVLPVKIASFYWPQKPGTDATKTNLRQTFLRGRHLSKADNYLRQTTFVRQTTLQATSIKDGAPFNSYSRSVHLRMVRQTRVS